MKQIFFEGYKWTVNTRLNNLILLSRIVYIYHDGCSYSNRYVEYDSIKHLL